VDNDQFNTTIKSCILDRMCLILICPGMFSHANSGCQEATSLNFERILCLWQCDVINMKPDLDTFSLDIFGRGYVSNLFETNGVKKAPDLKEFEITYK